MLIGGGQERGLRAGTENVLLAVALGEASRIAHEEADELLIHMLTLKFRLMKLLSDGLQNLGSDRIAYRFNGTSSGTDLQTLSSIVKMLSAIKRSPVKQEQTSAYGSVGLSSLVDQLPNTISISFRNIKASTLLQHLYDKVILSTRPCYIILAVNPLYFSRWHVQLVQHVIRTMPMRKYLTFSKR
jgi:cysteine sulfinate desulfinase/cysteine desulfurase-like protein